MQRFCDEVSPENDDADHDDIERWKLQVEGNSNRHMTTISVATLVLLVTFDHRGPCNPADVNLALSLFGLSLLCGLWGMISTLNGDFLASVFAYVPGKWSFTASAAMFFVGVVFVMLVPEWW